MEIYASHYFSSNKKEWVIYKLIRLDDILVWHLEGLSCIDPEIIRLPGNFFNREIYKNNFIYLEGDL